MIAELVCRARHGDAEAYTELVRRFQDAVYATAYQAALDPEAARDLAQDTFVRAYEALGSLRDPASFPGWVVRICRNLTASWLRRPERSWVSLDGLHVPAPDIAPIVASDDLVARALSALPEENRLALSLSVVNGYSYNEVADLTGVPTSTVKGRIHRAKRKLAAEVFGMVEESLKSSAPEPEFTVETVKKSLDRARELADGQQLVQSRAAAEEALEVLPRLEGEEEERRRLREEGLGLLRRSTFYNDPDRWAEATRESLRLCDEQNDLKGVADHLAALGHHARNLTGAEGQALLARCIDLYRELGEAELLGEELFFVGWHDVTRGEVEKGARRWDEARSALAPLPYGPWHACLDATDEFLRLAAGRLDPARKVTWGARCDGLRAEGERLSFRTQPGYSTHTTRHADDLAKFENGFGLMSWVRWFPWRGPEPGHEEELSTFSYTGNPTHTRVWVETDEATVETPAGRFEGCLLVRATVTESPDDRDTESRQRELNKMWCGERWLWLARGVGPVAYRHERPDGVVAHPVLARHQCPEERTEWMPLVPGARWEFAPADPPETFDAQVVVRLTHLSEDGTGYLATSMLGNLHDDQPS